MAFHHKHFSRCCTCLGVPMDFGNEQRYNIELLWACRRCLATTDFVTLGVPPAVRGRAAGGSFLLKNCCSTGAGRAYGVASQALLSLLHMFGRAFGLWQQTET